MSSPITALNGSVRNRIFHKFVFLLCVRIKTTFQMRWAVGFKFINSKNGCFWSEQQQQQREDQPHQHLWMLMLLYDVPNCPQIVYSSAISPENEENWIKRENFIFFSAHIMQAILSVVLLITVCILPRGVDQAIRIYAFSCIAGCKTGLSGWGLRFRAWWRQRKRERVKKASIHD